MSQGEDLGVESRFGPESPTTLSITSGVLSADDQKEAFLTTARLALGLTQDLVMTFCDFSWQLIRIM